jgi:hypothetical protein
MLTQARRVTLWIAICAIAIALLVALAVLAGAGSSY